MENLNRIEKIEISMNYLTCKNICVDQKFSLSSNPYLFLPEKSNNKFKLVIKNVEGDTSVNNLIKNEIEQNDVCLFMKGTPDAPQCGFSMATSNILKILEVNFKGINVLENQNLREGIKVFSDWPTIPQLYIKKEFIGGCDIVKEMYESGELKKILENKGINFKK